MMENNYFFKKLTSKHTEEKERCACKKQRIPIYITKTMLRTSKPERQITYST